MNRTTAPGSVGGLYVDDDPPNLIQGTLLIADDRNAIQEELVNAIEDAGLTPSAGDLTQLSQAIAIIRDAIASSTVLAKLLTVDGAGSTLDADLLDGQHGSFYQDAGNLNAGTIPLARIPATLTGKDADTLDGQHGSYYQNAGNLNAGTILAARMPAHTGDVTSSAGSVALTLVAASVLSKLLTVDGSGSNLDADLLDGQEGSFYRSATNLNAGSIPCARMGAVINSAAHSGNATVAAMDVNELREIEYTAASGGQTLTAPSGGTYFRIIGPQGTGSSVSIGETAGGATLYTAGSSGTFMGFVWRIA